jgi:hypothetical protein
LRANELKEENYEYFPESEQEDNKIINWMIKFDKFFWIKDFIIIRINTYQVINNKMFKSI